MTQPTTLWSSGFKVVLGALLCSDSTRKMARLTLSLNVNTSKILSSSKWMITPGITTRMLCTLTSPLEQASASLTVLGCFAGLNTPSHPTLPLSSTISCTSTLSIKRDPSTLPARATPATIFRTSHATYNSTTILGLTFKVWPSETDGLTRSTSTQHTRGLLASTIWSPMDTPLCSDLATQYVSLRWFSTYQSLRTPTAPWLVWL